MKARTGICVSLCGSLLLGCSSFPSLSGLFDRERTTPALRVAKDPDAEYQRGKRLHLAGQYADAQKAYLSALAIDPSHAEAKNGMAALIGANGDLDRAIGLLVELSRDYPASHVSANLGHAYELKGRVVDAREAYQHAIDLDPGNESAQRRLLALDEKLQGPVIVDVVIEKNLMPVPDRAQSKIESIGPSMYAMHYPTEPQRSSSAHASDDMTLKPVTEYANHVTPQQSRALPVELVNANGVTGLARHLRSLLPSETWNVVRTRNYDNFSLGVSRIEYFPSHRKEAQQFAQDIGIAGRLLANRDLQGARLRIILGHDCKNLELLKQQQASVRSLAAL
jgi:tetratricopeptide (TPR) repeat protein